MSATYNHRPLPPTAPAQPTRGAAPDALGIRETFRVPEALELIRQDFEGISSEINSLKMQRDEYEAKVNLQVSEISSFRQALYELEERHKRQREAWEAESRQLRAELASVQAQLPHHPGPGPVSGPGPVPGPPSGPSHVGASGYPPGAGADERMGVPPADRVGPGVGGPAGGAGAGGYYGRARGDSDVVMRDRERDGRDRIDRERERDRDREMRERERDRDRERDRERDRDRDRGERELSLREKDRDREGRRREKIKAEPDHFIGRHGPSTGPNAFEPVPGLVPVPPVSGSGPGPIPAPQQQQLLVTKPTTAIVSANPLSDLEPDQVPPELKKEGSDWWAIFNPAVPRMLDISLSLTLTHESVVCCVRFSSDGKYLATGCNRTAQIYDTKTGARTCVLSDEAANKSGDLYIRSVCFSPDGKFLATGAEDKLIRIWDIERRTIRHRFEGHTQEIYSLDFSRDGKLIVSGSGDKTARIWNMDTGDCKILTIIEPESIDAGVTSVAISPDGRFVAAGSLDMVVRIWDVASGALVERLKGHKDSVYSVAFSPDGRGLVSGSLDKSLKYWDLNELGRIVPRPGMGAVQALQQSTRVPSNSVGVPSDMKDGGGDRGSPCTVAFTGHKDYVLSVAVSPDGAWVVSGSKDRGVQFWNPKDAQTQLMLQGHKNSVISIDLSPAGGLLATGSGDWQARVWSYSVL